MSGDAARRIALAMDVAEMPVSNRRGESRRAPAPNRKTVVFGLGDQTTRKLSVVMSGVGAGDQLLDVELPSKPGVERADAFLELLPKRGQLVYGAVEPLRDAPLVRGGQKLCFRNSLVERSGSHGQNV